MSTESQPPHPAHEPQHAIRSRVHARLRLSALASAALIASTVGGIGLLMYVGRAAFVPILFAMLFALVLSTPVEALFKRGVPRSAGALLILVVLLGVLALALNAVWAPASGWVKALPDTVRLLEERVGPVATAMEHSVVPIDAAPRAGAAPRAATPEEFAINASSTLLVATPAIAVDTVTVVILTLFLLAGGAPMAARVAATLSSEGQSLEVLRIIGAVRTEVGRYYATLTLINVGLGAATALITQLLGLPSALLWGVLATFMNFIPYVGSAVTLIVLSLVTFITFNSVGHVLAVAGSFLALATIEGQVIEPLLIGRRLKLSPTVVFLALWFGGWFWGVSGVILALPLLVTLKVIFEQRRNGRVVVDLLSPTPRPELKIVGQLEEQRAKRQAKQHASRHAKAHPKHPPHG